MSENLPFDVQTEIIKRVYDIKSLIQFRCVSKAWKSLIDSPKFIAHQSVCQTQRPHHMLVSYTVESEKKKDVSIDSFPLPQFAPIDPLFVGQVGSYSEQKIVSIVDDDTFPQHLFIPSVPLKPNLVYVQSILGSSHGLLCFYGVYKDLNDDETMMAVLWNPSIRKSVDIVVPNVLSSTCVGFGVYPGTSDPKVVKITPKLPINPSESDDVTNCKPWQVEVFSLSSGAWRTPSCTYLPHKSISIITQDQVVIDGIIYWQAYYSINIDIFAEDHKMIISFDLKSEELEEVYLPDRLGDYSDSVLYLYNLTGSLGVIECYDEADSRPVCSVWLMNHGAPKSFKKLYTVKAPDGSSYLYRVIEFRKNGEAIMESQDESPLRKFELYQPSSKRIKNLGFFNIHNVFVTPYSETLLLLDQSDSITRFCNDDGQIARYI